MIKFILTGGMEHCFVFYGNFHGGRLGKYGKLKMNFEIVDDKSGDKNLAGALERMVAGCRQNHKDTMIVSIILVNEDPMGQHLIQLQDEGPFLKDLASIFGKDNVGVTITIATPWTEFMGKSTSDAKGSVSTKEMVITSDPTVTCSDDAIKFPNDGWFKLARPKNDVLEALVTVEVSVKTDSNRLISDKMIMFKMLNDEVHSDVDIAVGDGGGDPIKCHMSVLSAASPVFEAMFKTEMKESKTHRIEIQDMTEESVRAFLAYIYYTDLQKPNNDARLAYELLCAAQKYNVVSGLESEVIKIFLAKPVEWFDLEVVIKLFAFARNLPTGEELKKKTVEVLKRNSKVLPQSQTYNEMFEKDPAAAKELCQLTFALWNMNLEDGESR